LVVEVLNPETLTLVEGSEPQFLRFKANMPPQFVCDSTDTPYDCSFTITSSLQASSEDLACLGGGRMAQVAVGSLSSLDQASCGFNITVENWQREQRLPLQAKRDGIVDGDHNRTLDVGVTLVNSSGQLQQSISVASVDVS
jgi:hypothetical protein